MDIMDKKEPRPTEYDDELMREICWATGTQPGLLSELCEQYPHWPSVETIKKWLLINCEFAEFYIAALEIYQESTGALTLIKEGLKHAAKETGTPNDLYT